MTDSHEEITNFHNMIRKASVRREPSYYNRKATLLSRANRNRDNSTVEAFIRKDNSQIIMKQRAEERKKELKRTIETKWYHKTYKHIKLIEFMYTLSSLAGLFLAITSFEVNLVYNTYYLKILSPIDLHSLRIE